MAGLQWEIRAVKVDAPWSLTTIKVLVQDFVWSFYLDV